MKEYITLKWLIKKEFLSFKRNTALFYSYLLYILGVSFICYIGFLGSGGIHPRTWNTLFWISSLFGTMHICYRSFSSSEKGLFYYYYTITSPEAYLLSKIVYGFVVSFITSICSYLAFSLFLGNPVQNQFLYLGAIALGTGCLSIIFTLTTAIADKSSEKSAMVPILSFPTSLPVLILSVKLAKNALDGIALNESIDEIVLLGALFLIIFTLSILLYPFIWRS
ncbi:MAG: heme exporter protein CcmB [Cyclobacteriaceae bacterium]